MEKLRLTTSGVLLAITLAACGATERRLPAANSSPITVAIEVKVPGPRAIDRHYSLGCNPTSGTLPLAVRVCADIAAHPDLMLRSSSLTLCYNPDLGPLVTIHTTWKGRLSQFSGQPGCGWPGPRPLNVYYNASRHFAA